MHLLLCRTYSLPHRRRFRATALVLGLVITSGCGPSEVVTTIPEDYAHLKGIVTLYAYAARDLRRPPRKVDDLAPIFEKARIEDPQSFLTSTRDGQPYVIIWGLDLGGKYRDSELPLAYERVGKEGRRLLVTCTQQVRELSDEEFGKLEWPEGHEPQ